MTAIDEPMVGVGEVVDVAIDRNGAGKDSSSLSPSPVLFFDIKGATFKPQHTCEYPLHVSVLLLETLHGKVLNEADFYLSYPIDLLEGIKARCHVSLIREGGVMQEVEQASFRNPVFVDRKSKVETDDPTHRHIAFLKTQVYNFFIQEVFDCLARNRYDRGEVWCPIWNAWYERHWMPPADVMSAHGHHYRWRVFEMKDVSAWLVREFGLPVPERSEWTGPESLRWYLSRTRELYPDRVKVKKKSARKKKITK